MGQFNIVMLPDARDPLKLASVFLESLRVYRRAWKPLLGIAGLVGGTIAVAAGIALLPVVGYSAMPNGMDPSSIPYTMTPGQWAIAAVALIVAVLFSSYAGAASVEVAFVNTDANFGNADSQVSISQSFRRIKHVAMQLFWLQWVVTVLSTQFSPLAGPLLWILLAPAIPLGLIEGLGPSEAVERMWAISRGSRLRLLILEIILSGVLPVVILNITKYVILPSGLMNFSDRPTAIRIPVAFLALTAAAIAAQLVFVGLTCAYSRLRGPAETAVHAAGA